jgi:acyl-CoA thioesterase FadM
VQAPDVPPDDQLRSEARLVTRWVDEDNQRVLNNAVYLTLLEEARLRYFSGLGLMEADGGFPFVLAQTNARFVAPGRGGREVSVRLATTHDPATRGKRAMSDDFRARVAELEGLA